MNITAHIPVQSYGFIELTDLPDDPAEVERLYNRYAEKPIKLVSGSRVKLEAFVGGSIYYDEEKHEYTNEAGEVYLSGSTYAHSFEPPFDQQGIAAAMAKKYGVPADDIVKMWEMKAEISRGLGTALHAAMELYGRYDGLAVQMGKSANHDNPMVMEAVKQFYAAHPNDKTEHEIVVVDHGMKRAGRIDCLVITGEKRCIIRDWKSDVVIAKKLPTYGKQLNFYRAIMENASWVVEGMEVDHWTGNGWVKYGIPKEDV